jgi:hypothetical protein
MRLKSALILATTLTALATATYANQYEAELRELAEQDIAIITADPEIIKAIKMQNMQTTVYDETKILEMDNEWRAEVDGKGDTLIKSVMSKPASKMLAMKKEMSDGLMTEIFVMDKKGLNVAQSDVTSDYWQGDEAKWQETYLKGKGSIHISEIEQDESTNSFQSQVSKTIIDPETGEPIGAITVGVSIEKLL